MQQPYWLEQNNDSQCEFVICLISNTLSLDKYVALVMQQLRVAQIDIASINRSSHTHNEIIITTYSQKAWSFFQYLLNSEIRKSIDVAVLPISMRKKKLLLCDMDSTITTTESLTDVAKHVGFEKEVADITDLAMQGGLDFHQALQQRLKLLKNLPVEILHSVAETVQLNAGAEQLLRQSKIHGLRTVLISGGLEPIVSLVAKRLGFDQHICNQAEIIDNKITGNVMMPIVDVQKKYQVLNEICTQLNINVQESCCVGDGTNDLLMLEQAGLGIAFRGKTILTEKIPYQINHGTLENVAMIMGLK